MTWWVHAVAKPSKHRSRVGPFTCPIEAAKFVIEYRSDGNWRNISITGVVGT